MDLFAGIEKLGIPIAALVILAILFWKVVPPMVDSFIKARTETQTALISVVERNTEALTALKDITTSNCNQLIAHDNRVDNLGIVINRVDNTTQRTEGKVDRILEAVNIKH
jgi:hypothetical protein